MAQYARPDSDVQTTNWNPFPEGTLYNCIDEVTSSDSDYVFTDAMATNTLIVGLSDVTDPNSAINHTIRFRAKSANASKGPESCECVLYESSKLIATTGAQTLTRDAYHTYQYTLSEAEANLISDYTALRLHFIPNPGSGSNDEIHISWAEFEVPDTGPSPGWNKIAYTSEPPTPNAWNQIKQTGSSGWVRIDYEGE